VNRKQQRKPSFFVGVLSRERFEEVPELLRQLEAAKGSHSVNLVVFGRLVPEAKKILIRQGWHFTSGGLDEALSHARTQYHDLFVFLDAYHEVGPDFFTNVAKVGQNLRVGLSKDGAFVTGREGLTRARVAAFAPLVTVRRPAEVVEPQKPFLGVQHSHAQVGEPEPAPSAEVPNSPTRLASFMVATHRRPALLQAALRTLKEQEVPPGWGFEILVAGRDDDPGRQVAETADAKYVAVEHDWVTAKLNALIPHVRGELCLLADDDDLQDPRRLLMAVEAHEKGADFSASGVTWVYDTQKDSFAQWTGPAHFVGTTMSIRTSKLKEVGGWPVIRKGKDEPMAKRLGKAGAQFTDLSEVLQHTIVLQHRTNIWSRPALEAGVRAKKGRFRVLGMGSLSENPVVMSRAHLLNWIRQPLKVMLATIVLNEEEFIQQTLAQHLNWPGLVQWVFVEGATLKYAEKNPTAVTPGGLSVDGTSRLLREASDKSAKVTYIPHGWAGEGLHPQHQKIDLRNAYCRVADTFEPDLLIALDADEFYTWDHQLKILSIVNANPDYKAWLFKQRHVWRPPSIQDSPQFQLEVTGGYWAVPHLRVWKFQRGARYRHNHNWLDLPGERYSPSFLWRSRSVRDPQCVHLGFARDPQSRNNIIGYYSHRGESSNRKSYLTDFELWQAWKPGEALPPGVGVRPYAGPVPEVFCDVGGPPEHEKVRDRISKGWR